MPVIESISPNEYSKIGGASQEVAIRFTNLGSSADIQIKLEYRKTDDKDVSLDSEGNQTSRELEYLVDSLAPATPEDLTAESVNGAVNLQWSISDNQNCTGYIIYRSEASDGPFEKLVSLSDAMRGWYTDTTVDAKKTYWYRISAYNKYDLESEPGEAVSVTVTEDMEAPAV